MMRLMVASLSCRQRVDLRCFIKLYLLANGFLHSGQKSPSPGGTNGVALLARGAGVEDVEGGP